MTQSTEEMTFEVGKGGNQFLQVLYKGEGHMMEGSAQVKMKTGQVAVIQEQGTVWSSRHIGHQDRSGREETVVELRGLNECSHLHRSLPSFLLQSLPVLPYCPTS